jgi:hypothetical protein
MGPTRKLSLALGACLLSLAAPSGALAATKPAATTRAAADVTQSTATLTGTVDPNGAATTYFFQVGATRVYGGATPVTSAGGGNKPVTVTGAVVGLAPATTYHFRLVASNRKGRTIGRDRTLKTKRQPLGVTLAGVPNPVPAGGGSTLAGTLTGTGNAGRQVVLQANPFPYTQGFLTTGNAEVTASDGGFSFPVLSVPVNTQFRVLMPFRPEVVSPVVVVGAQVRVTTHVRVRRGSRRGMVRLSGFVRPAADGAQVLIQKFVRDGWVTIAQTFARHADASASRYSRRVSQRRRGRYRVQVNTQGAYTSGLGRTVRVRHVRR